MTEIKFGIHKIDLNELKDGMAIDETNEFLKKYDTDNNSIFSKSELKELKNDIKAFAGDDKELQENEALTLFAHKTKKSLEEIRSKFEDTKNTVFGGLNSLKNSAITKTMFDMIESNIVSSSITRKDFQDAIKQVNKDNVLQVLKEYKKLSGGESLVKAMAGELTVKDRKTFANSMRIIFNALLENVDTSKNDTRDVIAMFEECVKNDNWDRIDTIVSTVISMIDGTDGHENVTEEEASQIANTRNSEAQKAVDEKSANQGPTSRFLDWLAGEFKGMTEEDARKIISDHEVKLKELEALKGNRKAYAEKFEEIFGVKYNPKAISKFNSLKEQYTNAIKAYQNEMTFNNFFEKELEIKNLDAYFQEHTYAAPYLSRELYRKCCEQFKKETIDNMLLSVKDDRKKCEILLNLIKESSKALHENTLSITGGVSIEEFGEQRDGAYHVAYGIKNDTYLVAQDWINAQNSRLATTQIGMTALAIGGAMFTGGGSLALASSAYIVTDPLTFTEKAFDADGMSTSDWKNYWSGRAETVGWMVLGMGAGKIGQMACQYVKLNGLAKIASKTGCSIDDLLKNKNLPAEIAKAIQKNKEIASLWGVSTEVMVDISTTAMLQKDGATTGDWIMSIAGAIAGNSTMNAKIAKMSDNSAVSAIKESFPDFKLDDSTAKKILTKIREINGKLNEWSKTPTQRGYAYSSIVGITPQALEQAAKTITRLITDGIEKLFASSSSLKDLGRMKADEENLYKATTEAVTEIATRIYAGDIPNMKMISEEALAPIAQKYGVDVTRLQGAVETLVTGDARWADIADYFELSPQKAKADMDMATDNINAFKNKIQINSETKLLKSATENFVANKCDGKIENLFTSEHAKIKFKNLGKEQNLYNAVNEAFIAVTAKICDGEIPCKEMFDAKNFEDIAIKYGINSSDIVIIMSEIMKKDGKWGIIYQMAQKPKSHIRTDRQINEAKSNIENFRTKLDLYPEGQNPSVQKVADKTTEAKTETRTSEEKPVEKTEETKPKEETKPVEKEKFKVTDELYAKYENDVYQRAFFDSDSRAKAVEIMENYEKAIAGKDINYKNFDKRDIYEFINKFDINVNDRDRVVTLIKERFHKDVVAEETRINSLRNQYNISEEVVEKTDEIISVIKQKMKNNEKVTESEIQAMLEDRNINRVAGAEKRVYNDPEIKDFVESCTQRQAYPRHSPEDREAAMKKYNELYEKFKAKEELTYSELNASFLELESEAYDILKDMILKDPEFTKYIRENYPI